MLRARARRLRILNQVGPVHQVIDVNLKWAGIRQVAATHVNAGTSTGFQLLQPTGLWRCTSGAIKSVGQFFIIPDQYFSQSLLARVVLNWSMASALRSSHQAPAILSRF